MDKLLKNKAAIITGANQGFGLEVARRYLSEGANLALCARDKDLLEKVKSELLSKATEGQMIFAKELDVSNKNDVLNFVSAAVQDLGQIDILLNNAGIYGPMGEIEAVDWDEWEYAIRVNLFGSINMCRAVLPHFKAQRSGKILQLSGGGATNPMPRLSAYAVSKAGVVRFIETLAEEVKGYNIDVNAIAPGALNTRLLDEVLNAGPEKVGKDFYEKAIQQKKTGGAKMSSGIDLAVFLGSESSDQVSGKLISALWDNWLEWPEHLSELLDSDIYTLRRITGRDRGISWGDK